MSDHVIRIVRENVHTIGAIDDATMLVDLDLDDCHLASIAMELEDEFSITVTEEDYESWDSVGDIRATVTEKLDLVS